jgi:hypothetical protein
MLVVLASRAPHIRAGHLGWSGSCPGRLHLGFLQDKPSVCRAAAYEQVIGIGGKTYRSLIEQAFKDTPAEVVFPFAGLPGMGYMMYAMKQALAADKPVEL